MSLFLLVVGNIKNWQWQDQKQIKKIDMNFNPMLNNQNTKSALTKFMENYIARRMIKRSFCISVNP
jgi:hypothetical protein